MYKKILTKSAKITRINFRVMLLFVAFGVTQNALSQVTIGSTHLPNSGALLDLNMGLPNEANENVLSSKGLLLPRVVLTSEMTPAPLSGHQYGMVVYNVATTPETFLITPGDSPVRPGYYFNTGERWERLMFGVANWFYMPSIVLDVSTPGPHVVNLHERYLYLLNKSSTLVVASTGAPDSFKSALGADRFFYYVVGFDDAVFYDISIDANGILTYSVHVNEVSDLTFMNIVFVEK